MWVLIFECGISTWSWYAEFALRRRVSMSAIGSVMVIGVMAPFSPWFPRGRGLTGQRDRQQPVEKLPHPVAAQGHLRADRHALAQLELGDGLAGALHLRLLAGDLRQVADGAVDELGVARGVADTHVDDDLHDAGN